MSYEKALTKYKKARAKADKAKAKERAAWDRARKLDPRFNDD